jgi:hypothetical protein
MPQITMKEKLQNFENSAREHAYAFKDLLRKARTEIKIGVTGMSLMIGGGAEMLISLDAYRNLHLISQEVSSQAIEVGSWVAVAGAMCILPMFGLMIYKDEKSRRQKKA